MENIINSVLENTQVQQDELKDLNMFEVKEHPIESEYGVISGKKGIFVNRRNINIVSDRYEVHQPSEFLRTFNDVAKTTGLEVNRVMPNEHNGGLLLSAKFASQKIAGEDHDINLVFYTSHCGKYPTFLTLDTLRLACFNQLPVLYRNKSRFIFSEKHYRNALDMNLVKEALEYIPESISIHDHKMEQLKETKLSLDDFLDIWVDHYKVNKESKQFQTKVDKVKATYYNAPGQKQLHESGYKALQAMTFMTTHEGRDTKMKTETAFVKGGNDSLNWVEELLTLEA